jgi:hypothetical protein
MVLTLSTFDKKLSNDIKKTLFDLNSPDGYNMVTADELMEVDKEE